MNNGNITGKYKFEYYTICGDTNHWSRPKEALPPLPAIEDGSIVVLDGATAIWRHAMAFLSAYEELGEKECAIAINDPALGAVVILSKINGLSQGDVLTLLGRKAEKQTDEEVEETIAKIEENRKKRLSRN